MQKMREKMRGVTNAGWRSLIIYLFNPECGFENVLVLLRMITQMQPTRF